MYVSNNPTSDITSSNTSTAIPDEKSGAEFSSMITSLMERQTRKLTALDESYKMLRETARQQIFSMSTTVQSRVISQFTGNSNISSFSSSFSSLQNWFSFQSGAQSSLVDYLYNMSENNEQSAAGTVNELFTVQQELASILNSLSESSFAGASSVYSSVKAINMEVETFGVENIFSSIRMDVKVSRIEQYSKESVEDSELLENGGKMIEFKGKYIDVSLFVQIMDPIVLDLDGDGLNLKSLDDGVVFDLKGDGSEVKTGFVQGDDALLFYDSNGDGFCSDGKELFGDQEGDANGFAKLGKYDSNDDGVINLEDSVYNKLKVWNDYNGDGISQKYEIRSLAEAGVEELGLGYTSVLKENAGNFITEQGYFRRSDGVLNEMSDVQFRYLQNNI